MKKRIWGRVMGVAQGNSYRPGLLNMQHFSVVYLTVLNSLTVSHETVAHWINGDTLSTKNKLTFALGHLPPAGP